MVVSFSSVKGGTGKTSLCIHVANYCAAAGYKVLVIDFDIQNSLSFYYLDEIFAADRKNLALALKFARPDRQYSSLQLLWHRHPGFFVLPHEPKNDRGEHAPSHDRGEQARLRFRSH